MLDRKFIVDHADLIELNCRRRNAEADVRTLVEMETQRRSLASDVQDLNRRANEVSKTIGQAKTAEEREARKEQGRQLRQQKDAVQAEHDRLDAEITAIQVTIPNLSHPAAPVGVDDQANLELRRGRYAPREFEFPPLDHVQLGEQLDLLDLEGGARTTGHGFYFLRNEAVLLELALQRYALDVLIREGFTPLITPDLARDEIIQGTGYIPRGPETQIYSVENSGLSLVATAEITLGGLYADQTVDAESLPIQLCGVSHCYRTEAGAHGRATRGIYRVHQFTKVEMFAFTLPEQSDAMLDHICDLECRLFDGLEVPYRVVDTATGDLGGPAYRKFDLEAWMPGRGQWGEVTSTSNCTDYQARRLNIRYKVRGEKGTHLVHTLNGTAIAVSRAMIAVLENHQQADGSVRVPPVLQPWVGTERIAPRAESARNTTTGTGATSRS
jgi:seryl-tRNA synthetase